MKRNLITATVLIVVAVGRPHAQDNLQAAKDLYASAEYEQALAALTRVDSAAAPDVAKQADEYRAFCLYALGRTREAESIAEAMIRRDPLMRLDSADASPRVESMFTDVRKRLLPTLVRNQFRTAKSDFDQKDLRAAESKLLEARRMIDEANKIGVSDTGVTDVSVLVDGYLELIRGNTNAAPTPSTTVAAAPAALPPASSPKMASAPAAVPPASPKMASAPAAAAPTSDVPRREAPIYSGVDKDVVPPAAIDQRLPTITPELERVIQSSGAKGMIELLIDETGKVTSVTLRQSLNAALDRLVIDAAYRWKYRPATRNGVPVRFAKTVVVSPIAERQQ